MTSIAAANDLGCPMALDTDRAKRANPPALCSMPRTPAMSSPQHEFSEMRQFPSIESAVLRELQLFCPIRYHRSRYGQHDRSTFENSEKDPQTASRARAALGRNAAVGQSCRR